MTETPQAPPLARSGTLSDELAGALKQASGRGLPTVLLMMSTRGLDAVYGVHGRQVAATACTEMLTRLERTAGGESTIVSLETGEIALVCPDRGEAEAISLARRVVELVGVPTHDGMRIHVTANVGIATSEASDCTPEELTRDADIALSAAAALGPGSIELYRAGMRESMADQLRTAVELSETLTDGTGLFLDYQPVMDLVTNRLVGVEALVRWNHPDRGLVSPAAFVPVAEQTGLISALGRWVLDSATAQLAEWRPLVDRDFRLHVNLSPLELQRADLVDQVAATLDRHGVPPENLLLEITETGLMAGHAPVAMLETLRTAGVALGIDDFGTGYSSISYLRSLPVDMVKLDRSLTALVASSPDEYALTRAIFNLMHSSGLEIVAEGIEEHVQVAHLRTLRCRFGQGFLLARPGDPERVWELLRRQAS